MVKSSRCFWREAQSVIPVARVVNDDIARARCIGKEISEPPIAK